MLFVSRFVVSVGALFASARDFSSRSHPGDYSSLTNWGPVVSTAAWVRGHSAAPALNVNPSALVSRYVSSRRRVKRSRLSLPPERSFVKHSLTLAPAPISTHLSHSNLTRPGDSSSGQSITLTVLPYDGPKDLACRDSRRALTVYDYAGSRELAIYYRPTALVVYTGLLNYVQFWVDPNHYQLIAHVYRPRFVNDAHLANEYAYLDPTDFERWAVDDPVADLLRSELPRLLHAFGLNPSQHITIGSFERQLEERVAWMLASFYALGFLFMLTTMSFKEFAQLWKPLNQSAALARSSNSDRDMLTLPGVANLSTSKELAQMVKGNWWETGGEGTRISEYSTSTTFIELPLITTLDLTPPTYAYTPTPLPTSSNIPTLAEDSWDTSVPSHPRKTLPARPSGPRFKSAAWRRCRLK